MIIPDNLSPLPVLPPSNDSKETPRPEIEGFVCEDKIHEILVKPILVTPMVTARVPDGDGFAGRDDVATVDDASPFVTLSSDEAYVDEASKPFEPDGPHPALAEPRHATPPTPRIQPEKGFGLRQGSDRWWVLGMGVALLAIFGSGTLIELISNDAIRRSRMSPAAEQVELPAVPLPIGGEKQPEPQPLAASNPEYPAP
ncbi:hypothetical protein [Haloferula sp.]|uniref:hypothetical protein n=1 Tax=Haloferula sp. TaxID=2497595 RepID=UPI00329B7CCC